MRDFLRETRQNKLTKELIGDDANSAQFDDVDFELFKTMLPEGGLTYKDEATIAARVRCLVSKRHRATGTAHLSKEDLGRLSPEDASMRAITAPSEHWADEVAADLHAEMPWMGRATECAWHDLRWAARRGTPIKIAPMLINGPPGIGKSAWTRAPWQSRLGCHLGRAMQGPAAPVSTSWASSAVGAAPNPGGR